MAMASKTAIIYYAGFDRFGGVFSHVSALEGALHRTGWDVKVITLDKLPIWLKYLPHVIEKIGNYFSRPFGFLCKDRTTRVLYKVFFGRKVDLQIFEDIYISWNSKIPSITILHAVWSDNLQSTPVPVQQQRRLIIREAQLIERISHPVVTVSDPYFRYLSEVHFLRKLRKKIEVIELGLDQSKFHSVKQLDSKSLVFVGALEARKNVLFLLKVFARLSEVCNCYRLTVIGDGPEMGRLVKYARDNNLIVDFLGALSHNDAISEIHRHGIYVHTSVKESFSYALLEAKLAGLKTCAYSKLQVPVEFIDVAVDSFDVDEWCNRILNIDMTVTRFNAGKYTVEKMAERTVALAA